MNVSMCADGMVLRGVKRAVAESLSVRTPFAEVVTPATIVVPSGVFLLRRPGSVTPLLCCEDCGEMTTQQLLKSSTCPLCGSLQLQDITADTVSTVTSVAHTA